MGEKDNLVVLNCSSHMQVWVLSGRSFHKACLCSMYVYRFLVVFLLFLHLV